MAQWPINNWHSGQEQAAQWPRMCGTVAQNITWHSGLTYIMAQWPMNNWHSGPEKQAQWLIEAGAVALNTWHSGSE